MTENPSTGAPHEPREPVHRLWHDQPRDEHAISIDDVRSKAQGFERRVRRWYVSTTILFAAIIVVEAFQIWREPDLVERVGDTLTVAALLYLAWWFKDRGAIHSMPAGLGRAASVDFYRRQLASQRDLASHPWRYLVFFVPGVGLSLLGDSLDRPPAQTIAITTFGVALFLTIAWVNRRTARNLQAEIDSMG